MPSNCLHPRVFANARYPELLPNREVLFPAVELLSATSSVFENILFPPIFSDTQVLPIVPAAKGLAQAKTALEQKTNGAQTQTGVYPCTRTKIQKRFQ